MNRPRVLLLDEPLGALDLKLREEMQIELKQIQHEVGITFIYVTHDQEEALTMSDRIAVFNAGRIEQVGAPAEVYERPATRFVAGFVGTSNLISGDAAEAITGRRARSRSAPRRSASASRSAPVGGDEYAAAGRIRERRVPRAPTPATTSRSTPAPSSWSPSRTSRRPRPRRSRSRGALSASCGSDSTCGRSPRADWPAHPWRRRPG